jgi:hypothetical protein
VEKTTKVGTNTVNVKKLEMERIRNVKKTDGVVIAHVIIIVTTTTTTTTTTAAAVSTFPFRYTVSSSHLSTLSSRHAPLHNHAVIGATRRLITALIVI